MNVSRRLSRTQRGRLTTLRSLQPGWAGPGSDEPTRAALTAARCFLGALTPAAQDAWTLTPTPDGDLRCERDDHDQAPGWLFFLDVARSGDLTLVWFDPDRTRHQRVFHHGGPAASIYGHLLADATAASATGDTQASLDTAA